MLVLISYDLEDDRLRTKLAKLLEGHGHRVQFSVFECHLTTSEYRALLEHLQAFYAGVQAAETPSRFSVRCYRLCAACEQRIDIVGEGEVSTDPGYYLV